MYEQFYGLRERPFDLAPDPRYLFLTDAHREAMANIEYGMSACHGITILTGEAGTGKTTIIRTVLANAKREGRPATRAYLTNPRLRRSEFLRFLAVRLGLSPAASESKIRMLEELEARLGQGHGIAVVIDEAQGAPSDLLEEVRLLVDIESDTEKRLSVVLVGQPELGQRLNDPELRGFKQRVALRCTLAPLSLRETAAYIAERIKIAGSAAPRLFSRDAVQAIYERSRGIPRAISVICDNALLTGCAAGERPVGARLIDAICRDFDLPPGRVPFGDSTLAARTPASRQSCDAPDDDIDRAQHGQTFGRCQRRQAVRGRPASDRLGWAQLGRREWMGSNGLTDLLAEPDAPEDAEPPLDHARRSLGVAVQLACDRAALARAVGGAAVSSERLGVRVTLGEQPGDAPRALGHGRDGLAVTDQPVGGRDVSGSATVLADTQAPRGEPTQADGSATPSLCERSTRTTDEVAHDDPDRAQASSDVSMSLSTLADALLAREPGDADQALDHYRRCHEILRQLAHENPGSARAARDAAMSLSNLADAMVARGRHGDLDHALSRYQRGHEVFEQLAHDNPDSAQAARDLSISFNKLADCLWARGQPGDADLALDRYQRSLTVRERLARDNPGSAAAARDVIVSLERLAKATADLQRAGSARRALDLQMRSLMIALDLHRNDPQSVLHGSTAAASAFLAATRAHAAGDTDLAMRCLRDCRTVLQTLVDAGHELDGPMVGLYQKLCAARARERTSS